MDPPALVTLVLVSRQRGRRRLRVLPTLSRRANQSAARSLASGPGEDCALIPRWRAEAG